MTAILHVISGLGMGGAERNLIQLARALQGRGLPQYMACVGGDNVWSEELAAGGIGIKNLGVTSMLNAALGLTRLSSLIRRLKPAVVQGWMYHGDLFAALAHRITAGREGRRLFWSLRASDTDKGGYGRIVAVNARLSSWPDLVIANSKAGLDFHLTQGYRPRRAEVVPNGIDTEKFRPDAKARSEVRSELGIAVDAVVAIHVARVDPMKDHATFLAAMRSLPHLHAVLAGAGTETLSLPKNVLALGLRRDIERWYAAADIVVSTSAYAEGFSNTIAEGMSSGLIPIASDIGDARDIVGDAGQVILPGGPEAVVQALKSVAELPLPERQLRGERARQRICERFSLGRTIEHYARLYAAAHSA